MKCGVGAVAMTVRQVPPTLRSLELRRVTNNNGSATPRILHVLLEGKCSHQSPALTSLCLRCRCIAV